MDPALHFSRQAALYAHSADHSAAESLRLIARLLSEGRYARALDVATGPGFTAFEAAPCSDRVIATDPAEGMLKEARRIADERGIANVATARCVAEALPFRDAAFDLVTCRTAAHHFRDVSRAVRQMARVLRPGGVLIVADTASPEDPEVAAWMDDVERRRDPTHVWNLSPGQWRDQLADAGLAQDFEATTRIDLLLNDWTARSATPPAETARLRAAFRDAPAAVREAFRIAPVPGGAGRGEGDACDREYSFSWPVFVCRGRKPRD